MAVGRPPWPRGLVQTGSVHRVGHRLNRLGDAATFGGRTPCLIYPGLSTRASGARAKSQLTKVGRWLRERAWTPQLVVSEDGRITS